MAETTNLSIRMDKELKQEAEQLFNELGMNLTTALNIFVRQAVRDGEIPFKISLISQDKVKAIRNAEYMAMIDKSIKELDDGKGIVMTMDKLEELAK